MPDFFLVGAPKSGTTSLSEYLRAHPNVLMSEPKEPHFFQTDFQGRTVTSWSDYEKCFQGRIGDHLKVGEASAGYLVSEDAIPQILAHRPDAKIIVLLRNPADLVYSLHSQRVFDGGENVGEFRKAWSLEKKRLEGKQLPVACVEPKRLLYSRYGLLGKQVQRILEVVPRDQALLAWFEDLVEDPEGVFHQVQEFLGLPIISLNDYYIYNPNKEVRGYRLTRYLHLLGRLKSRLGFQKRWGIGPWVRIRFLGRATKRPPLTKAMRSELEEFFAEDIALLEKLTERNLSHWRPEIKYCKEE